MFGVARRVFVTLCLLSVGRYALYEFIISSCLLIVAAVSLAVWVILGKFHSVKLHQLQAADASNGQSGRLIVAHAGVPPIHLWVVRPILGFVSTLCLQLGQSRVKLFFRWLWP